LAHLELNRVDAGLWRAEMPGDVAAFEAAIRDPREFALCGSDFSRAL
jgi:hypothetical protein